MGLGLLGVTEPGQGRNLLNDLWNRAGQAHGPVVSPTSPKLPPSPPIPPILGEVQLGKLLRCGSLVPPLNQPRMPTLRLLKPPVS